MVSEYENSKKSKKQKSKGLPITIIAMGMAKAPINIVKESTKKR